MQEEQEQPEGLGTGTQLGTGLLWVLSSAAEPPAVAATGEPPGHPPHPLQPHTQLQDLITP